MDEVLGFLRKNTKCVEIPIKGMRFHREQVIELTEPSSKNKFGLDFRLK
jgi:hypothetical protein